MTPKNPSSHRKPAGGHRHQRQADRTLVHRSYDPDRRSHRHRRAWAPEIALLATSLAIYPPTKRSSASIEPVSNAASHRWRPSNPHRPQKVPSGPAGSFPGGFRTPALGAARYVTTGRHPKPFTRPAHRGVPTSKSAQRPQADAPNPKRSAASSGPRGNPGPCAERLVAAVRSSKVCRPRHPAPMAALLTSSWSGGSWGSGHARARCAWMSPYCRLSRAMLIASA